MTKGGDTAYATRFQGAVLIALVFVVGILAGSAVERLRYSWERPAPPGPPGAELPRPFEHLGITEEQRAEISEILQRGRPRTDSVLAEMMPHLQGIYDSIQVEIRSVLTAEQRALLDEEYQRWAPVPPGMGWRRIGPFAPDSPPGSRPPPPPPNR